MEKIWFRKEKVLELFDKIEKELKNKRKSLEKGFELDKKEWDISIEFDEFIKILNSNLNLN